MRIKTGGRQNPVVDAYGHNLLSTPHALGGGTSTHHNNIISVVAQDLEQSGIRVRTKGQNGGVCRLFTQHLLGGRPLGENGSFTLNGIIPDMVVCSSTNDSSGSFACALGGADHLVDFKTLASTCSFNSTSLTHGQVVADRQSRVNADYHKTASDLDALVHDTPANEVGPVGRALLDFGQAGRVLGPVISVYGSGSQDLILLRDLAASERARKHVEHRNMDFSEACAMFKNKLNRSWGQHIARGWATMLLDRLRDYVVNSSSALQRPVYADHFGPDSGVVCDQFHHFHGSSRDEDLGG